jgi:hypothetical protein
VYSEQVSLNGVRATYRNLRENYEYWYRYEEADQFFIREMELKRKYREKTSENRYSIKRNSWFRRNLSLTGLYYWISEYGQNYKRPIWLAIIFVFIPIFYLLVQRALT